MTESLKQAKAKISASGELLLYGEIGDWFESMDAESIVREVQMIAGNPIKCRVHSPGGSFLDGLAMYNVFLSLGRSIEFTVDGVAASAASFVIMSGKVIMPRNAWLMIHNAQAFIHGDSARLAAASETMAEFNKNMANIYATKTGKSGEEILAMMAENAETWISGEQAVEQGYADELAEPVAAAASLDLTPFSPPENLTLLISQAAAPTAINPPRSLPMKPKANTKRGGAQIVAVIASALLSGVDAKTADDRTRAQIYTELGAAVDAPASTVEALAKGEVSIVDQSWLEAFAQILDIEASSLYADIPAQEPGTAAAQAAVTAERKRSADIRLIGAQASIDQDTINSWIDQGLDTETVRAKALTLVAARDENNAPDNGHIRFMAKDTGSLREAMASAMLNRVNPAKHQLTEASAEFRGMSVMEMVRAYVDLTGGSSRGHSKDELCAKALHATSDFPLIIADVANKTLRQAYDETPRSFVPIAARTSATDFKDKHSLQIGNGAGLQKLNQSGEYERGSVSESDESYKVETFGRIFSFNRQLMINDDLSALTRFIQSIGGLAARKESDVIWGLVKANAAMSDSVAIYHATHKNLGTGGAVSETSLSQARKLMRQQKGLDGEAINAVARFLVVNSERETEAEKMLASVLANASSDVNVFSGSLQLIVESRLDGVTNNPWYTFAEPSVLPSIEYAYLDGQEGPMVETRNGWDVDGVEVKIRHDFGAGVVDYRGTVKNPGA